MTERDEECATLIVHRYFWPTNFALMGLMFKDIALMHRNRGESVTVVCGDGDAFDEARAQVLDAGVTFRSFRMAPDRGARAIHRLKAALRLTVIALRTLFSRRWHTFYTVSYPPGVAGILLVANRLFRRARFSVHFVQDIFTYRIGNPLLASLYRWWTGLILSLADRTITLSEDMSNELLSYVAPSRREAIAKKITVLNNFSVDSPPTVEPGPPVRDIIYAGNHGVAQNLEHFLEAVARMPVANRPSVDFFGNGDARIGLERRATELGLDSTVRFHDPVNREAIAVEVSRSRFGLVGAQPNLLRYAFPSKIVTYATIGTSAIVMCDEVCKTAAWLRETGLGNSVDPVDVERASEMLSAILTRADRDTDRAKIAAQSQSEFGRSAYLSKLSRLTEPDQISQPRQSGT